MGIFFVKHGGPKPNDKMAESAKFLKKFINLSNTFLLYSPDGMAFKSAMIMNEEFKLKKERIKKKKSLKVIKDYDGSRDHQLMGFLICFAAEYYDLDPDIIAVSHEGLIRKTLNAFYDIYTPDKSLVYKCRKPKEPIFKTTIERGSIHLIDTRKEEIQKIFTP